MQTLRRIAGLINAINERIGRLAYWLVLLMVIVGGWNVMGRFLDRWTGLSLSSNAFLEAQWYLYSLLFLLGGAYTLKHNGHVRIDVFHRQWSPKWQAIAELTGTLLFLIPFCILVLFFSWQFILNSWQIGEVSPDVNGLPRYPIKSMIAVGFGLLILQGISEVIRTVIFLVHSASEEQRDRDA